MEYLSGLWRNYTTNLFAIDVKYVHQTDNEPVQFVKVDYISDLTFSFKSGSRNYRMENTR
jgi:hypothetical protein